MLYSQAFTLSQAPLIGKDRAALKDDPAIFNCALKVEGDERKSAATVADLMAYRCVPAGTHSTATPSSM